MSFLQWLLSALSTSLSDNRRITPSAGWLTDFSTWLSGVIDGFWTKCADAITAFMEWAASLLQPIIDWFGEAINEAVQAVSDFFEPIIEWFGEQYDAIVMWASDSIEAVITWTSSVITGAYSWVTTTFVSLATWSGNAVQDGIAWVRDFGIAALSALWAALSDLMISGFDNMFKLAVMIINSIEMPDFIQDYSIGTLLGSAGPTIGWLVNALHIPEAMMVLAAGYAFRMLRKLLTLGQW